jgi:hypothetical protein
MHVNHLTKYSQDLDGFSPTICHYPPDNLSLNIRRDIQIFVKTLSVSKIIITLEAKRMDYVYRVQTKILDKEGTFPIHQRFIFSGQRLDDRCTMVDYNLAMSPSFQWFRVEVQPLPWRPFF